MAINWHLGVTGLRRTGKTVFLTALIHHLIHHGNKGMHAFGVGANRIEIGAATGLPPWGGLPRFPYEVNLAALRDQHPSWPIPTVEETSFTLEFSYRDPNGVRWVAPIWNGMKNLVGWNRVRLHLHDYPGEFLLDVPMQGQTFEAWSNDVIARMKGTSLKEAADYIKLVTNLSTTAGPDQFDVLRQSYATYLIAAHAAGLEMLQPAMSLLEAGPDWQFLSPSALASEKHLPFVPIPGESQAASALHAPFEDYKQRRVLPFAQRLRQSKVQLVLVDILRVLRNGDDAVNDLTNCLAEIMSAYRYRGLLFGGVKRVIFAATKADHVLAFHRANLRTLLATAVDRAQGRVGNWTVVNSFLAFTSIRATDDIQQDYDGRPIQVLRGIKRDDGERKERGHNPGIVPDGWPANLDSQKANYRFPEFECRQFPPNNLAHWDHIALDEVTHSILR